MLGYTLLWYCTNRATCCCCWLCLALPGKMYWLTVQMVYWLEAHCMQSNKSMGFAFKTYARNKYWLQFTSWRLVIIPPNYLLIMVINHSRERGVGVEKAHGIGAGERESSGTDIVIWWISKRVLPSEDTPETAERAGKRQIRCPPVPTLFICKPQLPLLQNAEKWLQKMPLAFFATINMSKVEQCNR